MVSMLSFVRSAVSVFFFLITGCNLDFASLDETDASGDTSREAVAETPCDLCTRENCGMATSACETDIRCNELTDCQLTCEADGGQSQRCSAACLKNWYEFSLNNDVLSCQSQSCHEQCSRPCGGWIYRVDTCEACMHQVCCKEATVCAQDPDCRRVENCMGNCMGGDWGCILDCNNLPISPESLQKDLDYFYCANQDCAYECGLGKSWGCVGKTGPIRTESGPISFPLTLFDSSNKRISNALVYTCRTIDVNCDSPIDVDITDDAGTVEVNGTMGANGFPVRLEIQSDPYLAAMVTYARALSGAPFFNGLLLLKPEEIDLLADGLGTTILQDKGHAYLRIYDCATGLAPEVTVSTSQTDATPFYFRNNYPTVTVDKTDYSGIAGFLNLPEGINDIVVSIADEKKTQVINVPLAIKKGWVTTALVWPE